MKLLRPIFLFVALLVAGLLAIGAVHPLAAQSDDGDITLTTAIITLTRQEDGPLWWTTGEPSRETVATLPEDLIQPGQPQYGEVTFGPGEVSAQELVQSVQPHFGDATFEPDAGPVPGLEEDIEALVAASADACAGSNRAVIVYTVASDPTDGSVLGSSARGMCLDVPVVIPTTVPGAGAGASSPPPVGSEVSSESPSAMPSPVDQGSLADGSGLLPLPGRWAVDTTKGRFACGGRTKRVPARKGEIGRITIDADGSGFELREADGSRPTDMRPDGPDGHFVGSARKRENGLTISLDYHLVVDSPELITGKLRGKANLDGVRCDLSESYRARYVGP